MSGAFCLRCSSACTAAGGSGVFVPRSFSNALRSASNRCATSVSAVMPSIRILSFNRAVLIACESASGA
jgi:hypothetical protein